MRLNFLLLAFFLMLSTSMMAQERYSTADGLDQNMDHTTKTSFQMFSKGPVYNNPVVESLTPSEGFESATFPPTGWDTTNLTPGIYAPQAWIRAGSTTIGFGADGLSFGSAIFNAFSASTGSKQELQTPNFPPTVAGEVLRFDQLYMPYTGSEKETLYVMTSTDGINYTTLIALWGDTNTAGYNSPNSLVTVAGRGSTGSPTSATLDQGWALRQYNLPVGTISIKFVGYSGFGNNIYLDNIRTFVPSFGAPYTGAMTINPSNPSSATNFQTFRAAADSLNNRGVAGNVTFNVSPGVYGPGNRFALRNVAGTSSINRITFQAAGGYVVIADTGTATTNDFAVLLNGTDWVTFDGINIRDASIGTNGQLNRGYYMSTYRVFDGPKNNTFKNCHIVLGGNLTPPAASAGILGTGMTGGATYPAIQSGSADSVTIQNVRINKVDRGIGFFVPITASQMFGFNNKVEISNCVLGDSVALGNNSATASILGVITQGCRNINVFNNRVDSLRNMFATNTTGGTAFALQGSSGRCYNNRVNHMFSAHLTSAVPVLIGIQIGVTLNDTITVYNNFVTGLTKGYTGAATATVGVVGIQATNFTVNTLVTAGINIYNNTVLLNNPAVVNYSSTGIQMGFTGLTYNIYNNNVMNTTATSAVTAKSYGMTDAATTRTLYKGNYNNIFVSGANTFIGATGAALTTALTLADWKAVTTVDTNSVSGNVTYSSLTPLTVNAALDSNWVLNGKGRAHLIVNNDINGNPRNTLVSQGTVDIGANEFTPSVAPPVANQTAAPTSGGTSAYTEFGDTVCVVTWGTGGTLPTGLTVRNRSGENPPNSGTAHRLASYLDVVQVGGPLAGTTYDMKMKYGYNELFNIPSIADMRMAKQDGGVWAAYLTAGNGAGQSEVVDSLRTITVRGLNSLSNFTATSTTRPLQTVGLAPNLLLPANNSTTVIPNNPIVFRWNKSIEGVPKPTKKTEVMTDEVVTNYWFDLHTDTTTAPIVRDTTLTDTTKTIASLAPTTVHFWRVRAKNQNGWGPYSGWFKFTTTVPSGIAGNETLPTEFNLYNNYPNPFNPTTSIKFDIPNDAFVSLKVYDMTGRMVSVLVSENKAPGRYEVAFNGSSFSSGVYFYRINAGSYSKVVKMILTK